MRRASPTSRSSLALLVGAVVAILSMNSGAQAQTPPTFHMDPGWPKTLPSGRAK